MVLGVDIDFVLDRTSKEGTENRGFVGRKWVARLIVSDGWIFAEGDAHSHNLFF